VHVNARHQEAGSDNRDVRRARASARSGDQGRGDELDTRPWLARFGRRSADAAPDAAAPDDDAEATDGGNGRDGDGPAEPAKPRNWVPRLAGIACYLIGLIDVLSAFAPRLRHGGLHRLVNYLPGAVESTAIALVVVSGVLLILLAHALRRRKRRAWQAVVVLLAASIVFHLLRHHGFSSLVLSVVFLVVLLVYHSEFYALPDPRSRWRALVTFVGLLCFSVCFGLMLLAVRPHEIVGHPSFTDRLREVLYGLVGASGPVSYTSDRAGDVITFSMTGLGILTVLVTVYLALRPAEPVAKLTDEDERKLRELLDKHGDRDSLGYFALRRDKSAIFSPSGKAAIAYRVVSGVMLASGDPIGDPEAWPGAIKRFTEEAQRHAWVVAVMGCGEQGGEVWCREAGLDALELGDEAICEVADFTLQGRAMRNVRQMVNRVERQGYSCQMRRVKDMTQDEIRLIRRQMDNWRVGEVERGFSMALDRFGDPADGESVLMTAVKDGEVRAFINFLPWGKDGLSLGLMRRDRDAEPGLNELMITQALKQAPDLGVTRISLNFAVFRSSLERGERIGAGPILRAWRGLLIFLSRWFQIESLYRFNAKFQPIWEPRFVAFRQTRDLPRIAIAALEAEAFLVMPKPHLPRRLRRRKVEAAT
jgi:lysyl-tRNA synthetase class 2